MTAKAKADAAKGILFHLGLVFEVVNRCLNIAQ